MEAIENKDDLLRLLTRLEYGYQLLADKKMETLLSMYQEQIADYGGPGHNYRKVFDVRDPPDLKTDFGEPLPGDYLKGLVERYNNKSLTAGEKEALRAFQPFRGSMGEYETRAKFDKAVLEARLKKNNTPVENGRYPFINPKEVVDFLQDYLLGLRQQRRIGEQDLVESALKTMQRATNVEEKKNIWDRDQRELIRRYEDRALTEQEKETLALGVKRREQLLAGAKEDDFYEEESEDEDEKTWVYQSQTYPEQVQAYLAGEPSSPIISNDSVRKQSQSNLVKVSGGETEALSPTPSSYGRIWLKFSFLSLKTRQSIISQKPNTLYELLALDLPQEDKQLILAVDGFQEQPEEEDLQEVLQILNTFNVPYGEAFIENDHLRIATTAKTNQLEARLAVFICARLEPSIYFFQYAVDRAPVLVSFK